MFELVKLRDTVTISPKDFSDSFERSAIRALNTKLANKVVHNLGLCIALCDLTKIGDSFVFPGDGSSHTTVEFRFVVFRPLKDEILVGKIKSSNSEGLYVTMGFFDDILIPAAYLPYPSIFNEAEQVWVWQYKVDDVLTELKMERDEEIRFKVIDEIFVDTTPNTLEKPGEMTTVTSEKNVPYTVIGSIEESGLGPLRWWSN